MRKRNLFIVVFVCFLTFVYNQTPIWAYHYLGSKWPSSSIKYNYDNQTSSGYVQTFFGSAANVWSKSDVTIRKSGSGNDVIYCIQVSEPKESWDGISSNYKKNGIISYSLIEINKAITKTWNNQGALKSVVVHEFGHTLGLDHTNGAVIMNPYTWGSKSRYGEYGVTVPASDDIKGINALY